MYEWKEILPVIDLVQHQHVFLHAPTQVLHFISISLNIFFSFLQHIKSNLWQMPYPFIVQVRKKNIFSDTHQETFSRELGIKNFLTIYRRFSCRCRVGLS